MKNFPLYCGGEWVKTESTFCVVDPFSGEEVAKVATANAEIIELAIVKAQLALDELAEMPVYERAEKLLQVASVLEKRVHKGKSTSYYFKLNNKNLSKNAEEFNVSKLIFNAKNIGDTVNIFVNEGKLKIPYYKIK